MTEPNDNNISERDTADMSKNFIIHEPMSKEKDITTSTATNKEYNNAHLYNLIPNLGNEALYEKDEKMVESIVRTYIRLLYRTGKNSEELINKIKKEYESWLENPLAYNKKYDFGDWRIEEKAREYYHENDNENNVTYVDSGKKSPNKQVLQIENEYNDKPIKFWDKKAAIKAAAITASVLVSLGIVSGVKDLIKNSPNNDNEPEQSTVQVNPQKEETITINYKIKSGEITKERIAESLKVDVNDCEFLNTVGPHLRIGDIVQIIVPASVGEKYNYNNEIVKYKICSYEVTEGQTITDVVNDVMDEYWIYENCDKNPNELKAEIIADNPNQCSSDGRIIQIGSLDIYHHDTQANIDILLQEGKLPSNSNLISQ